MKLWIWAAVAAVLMACGGGGGDGPGLTPEDYVPAEHGFDLDALEAGQRYCVLYGYVSKARLAECGTQPATAGDMHQTCIRPEINEDLYTGEGRLGEIPRCLDFWASASCEAIEGTGECALVEDWDRFR